MLLMASTVVPVTVCMWPDLSLDFFSGLGGLIGKVFDLAGDHGEALSRLRHPSLSTLSM